MGNWGEVTPFFQYSTFVIILKSTMTQIMMSDTKKKCSTAL